MANCNCGNVYNVGMGCCEPVLGPIENYYTKYQVDKLIEGAVISGCCITPEEVDEKIEEAISGISVSGVTEEELQEAIDEAKTEIEAEMPVVPTNVSAFNNDVPYLTEHQSLSAYSTTEEMNEAISAATDNLATVDYVNTQISSQTADFVTGEELSSYTYDKATIDSKIASGGTFDPTQYYNKAATDELLAEKLDASAYTPTDLSNYYNKQEVDNKIASAKTEIEGEIPSLSGYATEQWVLDKNYITGVDLSNYATKSEIPTVPTNVSAFNNDAGYLTEHQSLSAYSTTEQMNGAISAATSGLQPTLSAGTGIDITDNVISATGGGGAESTVSALTCYKEAIPSDINYSEGSITTFYLKYTGGVGGGSTSYYFNIYNNGVEEYKSISAGYNAGVFTSVTSSNSAYTATIDNGNIKVVLTNGCSFKRCSSSTNCTPFLITQYSSGTTSDVMVNTVYDAICRLSDKNINNVIKRVDGYIGDGKLYLYNQGTLGTINTSIEIASNTINTDGSKLNVHFTGETQHDAIINTGSGNYCELFSLYEYSKGKDDITITMNSAYTGSYTITPFSISFIDSSNNRHQFNFEYNITANTISTPSGYATYGTIVDTLSTDYKVKFLPNTGYKIASFMNNSCLIGGIDNSNPNNFITNLVTTTSYDYNGQEIIDDLYSKIPKIWCGTQAEYEQILVKDPNTLYLIHS